MNPVKWKEITEQRYNEMLEMLPPALTTFYGFLLGEPQRADGNGCSMFKPFFHFNGRHYEGDAPLTRADFRIFDVKAASASAIPLT